MDDTNYKVRFSHFIRMVVDFLIKQSKLSLHFDSRYGVHVTGKWHINVHGTHKRIHLTYSGHCLTPWLSYKIGKIAAK